MMSDVKAEAGMVGAMVAVLAICLGTLFLINAVYSHPVIESAVQMPDIHPGDEAEAEMAAMVDAKGWSGMALDVRDIITGAQRQTVMVGEASAHGDTWAVITLLPIDGERLPCRITCTVWYNA